MRSDGAPGTARARVRHELTQEIKDVARSHLAQEGTAGLSLRAIARELGMVSSAIYRYFPSRDELLTALIVDAYTDVAGAAEQAEAGARRDDPLSRWLAVAHATRQWALAHPQEYALIFGSPVPGYRAPQDTIDPAARIPLLLLHILAASSGDSPAAAAYLPDGAELPASIARDLRTLQAQLTQDAPAGLIVLDEHALARGIMIWTLLIGSISFELFGHLQNVIHDHEAHFDVQMRAVAAAIGIAATA